MPSSLRIALWVLLAVAVVLGLGFGACAQDDAFISFRYAANLLAGEGLVYNPGEWVEGYTNLSWTLLMAAVMGLGVDPVAGSTALGLVCMAAAVASGAGLARRVHGTGGAWVGVGAAALMAVDPWSALEAVEGLETALYLLLVTAGARSALREADAGRAPWGSSVWFCIAVLTRPEAPLVAALVHLGLLLAATAPRDQLRRALHAGALVGLTLGGLTLWRLQVYGVPLPNTFYAKTGGLFLSRGLVYMKAHMIGHPALWLVVVARLVVRRLDRRDLVLLAPVLGVLAYVLAVGGDFKPTGRFVMPIHGLMAAFGARALVTPGGALRRAPALVLAGVLVVGASSAWRGAKTWADIRHANLEARRTVGLFLRDHLPPDTLLAIHSAGAVPFYAGLPTIDMWGLTDAHIARSEAPAMGTGLAGHERSDPAYVFGLDPAVYLPEDRMFTLKPRQPEPDPGFPADFTDQYEPISIPVEGRFLNVWVRKGFLAGLAGAGASPSGG